MAMVNFKKGLLANLPATYAEGTFYVTTDEHALYLDVSASERIRITDFQKVASVSALPADGSSAAPLQYVQDINCLAVWDGSEWIQVNRDTGMTSVEVTGDGNAVTAAIYSADGRKLTLTKGATFATPAEVDSKIAAKVGEIGEQTVKDYVDAKTAGIASDEALTTLAARVTTAESDIDALETKVGAKAVSTQIDEKIEALDLANTYEAKGATATAKSEVIGTDADTSASDTIKGAKKYADEKATAAANSKDAAIAAAKAAGDAAQTDVDALGAKVGSVPEGKTVVQMISDAQTAATYDDTEIKVDIQENTDAIAVLNGAETQTGSVKKIVSDEIAKVVAGAPESFDTLKEVSDWIATHGQDAATMNSAILALQNILDGIGDTGSGEKATVVAYVTDAIAALNIGDYANAAELTALAARVTTLEDKSHEHDNKALLDTYTQTEANLADAVAKKHSHANATELDKIAEGDKAKWDAAESKAHEHTNKTVLDGITAGKVDGWDAAEQNAKDYADSLADNYDAAGDAAQALADAKTYADTAEADAVSAAKAYTDAALTWGSF